MLFILNPNPARVPQSRESVSLGVKHPANNHVRPAYPDKKAPQKLLPGTGGITWLTTVVLCRNDCGDEHK